MTPSERLDIARQLERLADEVKDLKMGLNAHKPVYTNAELMKLLDISTATLKKWRDAGLLGYMKQLGTTKDLTDNQLWLNSAADTKIQQAFRATPTVAWNLGKFTVSLEYNLTAAEIGNSKAAGYSADAARGARGLFAAGDTHWLLNHRFICMTKFNF